MINFEQGEMQAALSQLDMAITNHGQWFDSITRTLICSLPYDRRDAAKDAHRQCLFGQWYYGADPGKLGKHPGFAAIESEHKRMHQLAAGLLLTAASGNKISTLDYDSFANSLQRLRLQLYTLKRELEDALYNLDTLTGAISRIGMLTKLREQQELVKRKVQSCCIAMLDLDHFKLVNDRHGHAAGDKVLAAVARHVMQHIRPYDKLFRYGGEEFLICMPSTEVQTGFEMVERLRLGIAGLATDHDGKGPIHVTVSFGLSMLDPDVSVEQSIERVDKAMYSAKEAGRNCSRIWDPSM